MNQDEAHGPPSEPESASSTATVEETTPQPEPMTPEKVSAWNRYIDRYIACFVVLLVFLAFMRPIAHSTIWPLLKTGELIGSRGPVTTDPFSYTEEGKTWVNVPWVFELLNWQMYSAAQKPFATDLARAEFVAACVLCVVHALILGVAAILLMGVRRAGPGLWWAAICVTIALGGSFIPFGSGRIEPAIGGMSWNHDVVSPQTWGILLMALELHLIHRGVNLGRRRSLYALPVVFLLWANIDESFLLGLAILAAWLLGAMIPLPSRKPGPGGAGRTPLGWPVGLGVLAACAAACLANPSIHRVYPEAVGPYVKMVRILAGQDTKGLTADQLTFFDSTSQAYFDREFRPGAAAMQVGYYLTLVCMGAISFALNRRRFAPGRFLAFLVAALFWAGMIRLAPFFSLVFAAILTLNGQEWYQDRFGGEGRVGVGWKLWSDGMRAVTILALLGFLTMAITGFAGIRYGSFGWGVDKSRLAFDTADYLRDSGLKGRVLNLTLAHGDAMIWRDPVHKTFIDNRRGLFPEELRSTLQELRSAFGTGAEEKWRPIVDKYGVTAIMVSPEQDPRIFDSLLASPTWVPFHDGGAAVLFGRVDEGPDVALFKDRRLDADAIVFHRNAPVPDPERTPTQVGWLEQILRSRDTKGLDPHLHAADRWLLGRYGSATGEAAVVDPARCLMAIREARAALDRDPDDSYAFEEIQKAYYLLSQAELVIIAQASAQGAAKPGDGPKTTRFRTEGSPQRLSAHTPTTPSPAAELNVSDAFSVLLGKFLEEILTGDPTVQQPATVDNSSANALDTFRFRQRVAALNYAIQTTPPPREPEARTRLAELNATLAQLYIRNRIFDLAQDRLQAASDLVGEENLNEGLVQNLRQLDEQVELFRTQLDEITAAGPSSPTQRANLAVSNGFPGIAIEILRNAESEGVNPAQVKPILMDLYCQVGRPDEAFNLLEGTTPNDPTLATGPGTAAYRQGLISLLLGYYKQVLYYWDGVNIAAIPDLRRAQVGQGLAAARSFLVGDPASATRGVIDVAGMPGSQGLVQTQAQWEAELGLALLELGLPQDVVEKGEVRQRGAIDHFRKALQLDPDMAIRPLIAYYLEKLGGEVPPSRNGGASAKGEEGAPAKPSSPRPDGGAAPSSSGPKPEPNPGEPTAKDAKEAEAAKPVAPEQGEKPGEKSGETPAEAPKGEEPPKASA